MDKSNCEVVISLFLQANHTSDLWWQKLNLFRSHILANIRDLLRYLIKLLKTNVCKTIHMLKNVFNMMASAYQDVSRQNPVFNISSSNKFDLVLDRNDVENIVCMCGAISSRENIAKMYETEEDLFIACKRPECRRQVSRKITPSGKE